MDPTRDLLNLKLSVVAGGTAVCVLTITLQVVLMHAQVWEPLPYPTDIANMTRKKNQFIVSLIS